MKKYRIGFVSGFFDILHEGHIDILELAKSQCEQLIVAVGTDEFMRIRKRRDPVLSYSERVRIVEAIKYVDRVVEEADLDKVAAYQRYHFEAMFAGNDHQHEDVYIRDATILKERYDVDTIYVERSDISSTKIRNKIKVLVECK